MLERYFGRSENPKVEPDLGVLPKIATNAWQKQVDKDTEFKEWFSGSVVSDSSGNPVPVFHARRGPRDFVDMYKKGVSELGVHFGTITAANERLTQTFETAVERDHIDDFVYKALQERILKSNTEETEKQKELDALELEFDKKKRSREAFTASGLAGGEVVYPVFLRIVRPVRVTDPGSFTQDRLGSIKRDLVKNFITRDEVTKIQQARSIEELKNALIELGYDGVVYKNDREGKDGDSYIPIVGPEQIRSVFSTDK